MKLQQLKYIVAIADNNLSITTAAEKIYTSQPGVSKQLRLLEDELQIQIFDRSGKQLVGITPLGEEILDRSRKVLQEIDNIKRLTSDAGIVNQGSFSIATTQTQAKYVLPHVLKDFHKKYPNLKIDLQQGTTEQIIKLLKTQQVEFAIASDNENLGHDIIKIPCYQWDRIILFPQDHELGDLRKIDLTNIAKYPIVTYPAGTKNDSSFLRACAKQKLDPSIVFTARDADIIKTYVKNGFGVGIMASMAFDPKSDPDLISYSTKDILPRCTTWIAFNKNLFLRKYMKEFIEFFAPHITEVELNKYLFQRHTSSFSLVNTIANDKDESLPTHRLVDP